MNRTIFDAKLITQIEQNGEKKSIILDAIISLIFIFISAPLLANGLEGSTKEKKNANQTVEKFSTSASEKPADLSLEELLTLKVTTASKREQNISEAPAAMVVITARQIQERAYLYLDDALRDLPGFDFIHLNGCFPTIWTQRGLYGDENKRTLVLIDGFVENNLFEGNVLGGPQYSLHNVKRIEILYGPASALYGANALNGIINIITKKGRDINGFEYHSGIGTNHTFSNQFLAGHRLENGLEYSLSASLYKTDGPVLAERHPEYSESYVDKAYSIVARFSYKKNLTVGFSRFDRPMGFGPYFNSPSNLYGLPKYGFQDRDGISEGWAVPSYFVDNEHASNWHSINNRFFIKNEFDIINEKISLKSQFYYRNTSIADDSYIWFYKPTENDEWQRLRNSYLHFSKSLGGELRTDLMFGTKNSWITGISYDWSDIEKDYRERIDNGNLDDRLLVRRNAGWDKRNAEQYHNYAMYSQVIYNMPFLNIMDVVAGIRFDYNSFYGSTTNPRLALVTNIKNKLYIKPTFGMSYRAPTHYEAYSAAVGRVSNPDLKPEKGIMTELIINWLPLKKLNIEGSLFYNRITNIIVSNVPIGDIDGDGNPNNQNQNKGKGKVFGAEFKANATISKGISAFANFTWLFDATLKEEGSEEYHAPNIADVKGNLGINISSFKPFNFDLTVNWTGNRSTLPTNPEKGLFYSVNGYIIFNITISATGLFGNYVDLSLSIRNLFDADYYDPGIRSAGAGFYPTRYPQAGRSAFFKISLKL